MRTANRRPAAATPAAGTARKRRALELAGKRKRNAADRDELLEHLVVEVFGELPDDDEHQEVADDD